MALQVSSHAFICPWWNAPCPSFASDHWRFYLTRAPCVIWFLLVFFFLGLWDTSMTLLSVWFDFLTPPHLSLGIFLFIVSDHKHILIVCVWVWMCVCECVCECDCVWACACSLFEPAFLVFCGKCVTKSRVCLWSYSVLLGANTFSSASYFLSFTINSFLWVSSKNLKQYSLDISAKKRTYLQEKTFIISRVTFLKGTQMIGTVWSVCLSLCALHFLIYKRGVIMEGLC